MDWLTTTLEGSKGFSPSEMIARLIMAFLCGYLVSVVYRLTRAKEDVSPSFIPTLVLLTILIALVSQVIGESVAKAFSLVGTLSIVRFRTVVRDTQDTAFVIFAVVVGMAVGSSHLLIALIGIAVVGAAAFLVQPRNTVTPTWEWSDTILTVKIGMSQDHKNLLVPILKNHLDKFEVASVSTARQGVSLEISYKVRFKPGADEPTLVKELNAVDGVQSIDLHREELED